MPGLRAFHFIRKRTTRSVQLALLLIHLCTASLSLAQESTSLEHLPGTTLLTTSTPLHEDMVAGIDNFALREIATAREKRSSQWKVYVSSPENYERSLEPYRNRFREIIGAVETRVPEIQLEDLSRTSLNGLDRPGTRRPQQEGEAYSILPVRWRAFADVTAEGVLLLPTRPVRGMTVAVPDATWTPEEFCGAAPASIEQSIIPRWLAHQGVLVLIPTLLSREATFSGVADVAMTNQTHREWIYRQSFELGRHPIGYEVLKIQAAVDALEQFQKERKQKLPIGVCGIGEGGLLALYTAALDSRIDSTLVCGYFQPREQIWQEPIDRNVFRLLIEFGDAEIAGMIAPSPLTIEACKVPDVTEPLAIPGRRTGAAPGQIRTAHPDLVRQEFERAQKIYSSLSVPDQIRLFVSGTEGNGPSGTGESLQSFLNGLGLERLDVELSPPLTLSAMPDVNERQLRQVRELVKHSEQVYLNSANVRNKKWSTFPSKTREEWIKSSEEARKFVWDELIGRLPDPSLPLNPRTRKILDEPEFTGYDVLLDVHPDLIAGGILLLPRNLSPTDKRPVVICQHGLEGVPMATVKGRSDREIGAYKDYASQLVKQGYIVYAPQNPYIGADRFRTLQRKSNPIGLTLFSYILPQHQATLKWLAGLPNADASRIGFYGISYGGKTAMRVPTLLPEYSLAICSADFNEWVLKCITNRDWRSYVYAGEYEIWEWNMAHLANYAELAFLMAPRPFMVERGHHDGVAIDEWVAWEFAKVRRFYTKLGVTDQTEIEYFDGPHAIYGHGTFDFLRRHLKPPQ